MHIVILQVHDIWAVLVQSYMLISGCVEAIHNLQVEPKGIFGMNFELRKDLQVQTMDTSLTDPLGIS